MTLTNKQIAVACFAIAGLSYLVVMQPISENIPLDFRTFYYAGKVFRAGANIYDHEQLNTIARSSNDRYHVFPYLYPPPLAICMGDFGGLDAHTAAIVWGIVSIVCIALILFAVLELCSRLQSHSNEQHRSLVAGAVLFMLLLPFGNNVWMGQVNLVVSVFIVFCLLVGIVHRRDFLAGLLLSAAAMIKLTPMGLLIFFVLQRQYKVVSGFTFGVVLIAVSTLLPAHGSASWRQFARFVPFFGYGKTAHGLFPAASVPNFSVAGWVSRTGVSEESIGWVTAAILICLSICVLIVHLQARDRYVGVWFLLPYLILMIVGSPLTYVHHVAYIYPGVVLALAAVMRSNHPSKVSLALVLFMLVATASIDFPLYYGRLGVSNPLMLSINLYSLIALYFFGLCLPRMLNARLDVG